MMDFYSRKGMALMKGCILVGLFSFSSIGVIAQEVYTFTHAGATGRFGPTQEQINSVNTGTNLEGDVTINVQGIQEWVVPATGEYRINAYGAAGGGATGYGLGAKIQGERHFEEGDTLLILVGQKGGSANAYHGSGGGGSFVAFHNYSPILVAGGGGGKGSGSVTTSSHGSTDRQGQTPINGAPGGINGGGGAAASATIGGDSLTPGAGTSSTTWASGGGGYYSNGGAYSGNTLAGGFAFINGGLGGQAGNGANADGGFGGGGGAGDRGAGGGGYSGGGGATENTYSGGGGGSYNSGINQVNEAGINAQDGKVEITYLYYISFTESPLDCVGSSNAALSASVTGGTQPYSYLWSTGDTTSSISGLVAGEYTVTVTDSAGLETMKTHTVTQPDPISISFEVTSSSTCGDNPDGVVTAVVSGGTGEYTYNWESPTTTASINGLAAGSYSLTVTDANGCTADSSAEVSVDDTTLPSIAVRDVIAYFDENGTVTISVEDVDNNSSDDCGIESKTLSVTEFTCGEILDDASTTLTVIDYSENSAEATASVTLLDTIKPHAVARDITVYLNQEGFASIDADLLDDGSYDNCTIASMVVNKEGFNCENLGANNVDFTVTDLYGNSKTKTSVVTVVDTLAPELQLHEVTVYLNEEGTAAITVEDLETSSFDPCGVESKTLDTESFNCENIGANRVHVTISDGSYNSKTDTTIVTVVDTIAPTLALNTYALELNAEGYAAVSGEDLMFYADDNCSVADILLSQSTFTCDSPGENNVVVTVIDNSGNEFAKTITLSVSDTQLPEIEVEESVAVYLNDEGVAELSLNEVSYAATDNCGIDSVSLSQTIFSCSDTTVTVTITAIDNAGNEVAAQFAVEVIDEIAPFINSPAAIQICEGEIFEAIAIEVSDNCAFEVSKTSGPEYGSTPLVGEYVINLEVQDASGNIATTSTLLKVKPNPVVDLGEDMEVAEGDTITLVAGNALYNSYFWSTGESERYINLSVSEETTVFVDVVSPFGCSVSDTISIALLDATGIDEVNTNGTVSLYPNPVNQTLNLKLNLPSSKSNAILRIFDLEGRSIKQIGLGKAERVQTTSIDLSDIANGTYIINISADSFTYSQRIVKQ